MREDVLFAMYEVAVLSSSGYGVPEIIRKLSESESVVGRSFRIVLKEYDSGITLERSLRRRSRRVEDEGLKRLMSILADTMEGKVSDLRGSVSSLTRRYLHGWGWKGYVSKVKIIFTAITILLSIPLLVSTLLIVLGGALENLPIIGMRIPSYTLLSSLTLYSGLVLSALATLILWLLSRGR